MAISQTLNSNNSSRRAWKIDRLFDAAKKDTVIRLRWPLVILSSYLLYYTPSQWLTPTQVQAILILYLLSHTTLYFLADDLFDSRYFYGPLLLFDTIVLAAVVSTIGTASPDFYLACLFTLVVSCICNDTRGLLAVTILAPLVYAYIVFYTSETLSPNIYLRLPFPFVISLFYGYFAQVERIRRVARDKEEQVRREQKTAEEIRRQRERLDVIHRVNLAITSTIDTEKLLASFLETALIHLPYAAAIVRLRNHGTGALETAAARGLESRQLGAAAESLAIVDRVVDDERPLIVRNVFTDPRVESLELFKNEGLLAFIALPLIANQERIGCLVFLARDEHDFGAEEIDFLLTLTGQAAIAIHHAELYDRSQRQAEELRGAHKVKDDFLGVVSNQLKSPLNVITGYADMFLDRLLGEITPLQEKAIETVARQSRELQGLINTILQVSSMESESPHVEIHEVNLWEFLTEVRSIYDDPLAKDVKLLWDYPSDLPLVRGDRGKLRHIIENLINNAIKYTEQGAVTITARYLISKEILELKVADSGVGIAKDRLATIFERFRQAQDLRAGSPRGGVGLGLYIVKTYTDLLGGKIHVESRPGEGSIFTLQIPMPLKGSHAPHEQLLLPTEAEAPSAAMR